MSNTGHLPPYYRVGHCRGCRAVVYAAQPQPGREFPMMTACRCESETITIILKEPKR